MQLKQWAMTQKVHTLPQTFMALKVPLDTYCFLLLQINMATHLNLLSYNRVHDKTYEMGRTVEKKAYYSDLVIIVSSRIWETPD